MEIHTFLLSGEHRMERYNSREAFITLLTAVEGAGQVSLIHLEPGGLLGDHPATVDQLFFVIAGEGWVQASESEPFPLQAGQAAFWLAGESHAAGTENGLTALVIEAEKLSIHA